ncbi:MAG: CAP domain-containing protein [Polyangiaceae bacterium]|nr:CAP domain-containing protein [Polyangiaceae bacterium]
MLSSRTLPLFLFTAIILPACHPKKPATDPLPAQLGKGKDSLSQNAPNEEVKEPIRLPPERSWASATWSPRPGSPSEPELEELIKACGAGDVALHIAAQDAAQMQVTEGEAPTIQEIVFLMRRQGNSYVQPRLWAATLSPQALPEAVKSVNHWSSTGNAKYGYRCGAGLAENPNGTWSIVVIASEVLADARPIPLQVESGKWLDIEIRVNEAVQGANLIVLPPEGAAQQITTELHDGTAKARVNFPVEGLYQLQLMGALEGGPRPVAEAWVVVGPDRPRGPVSEAVPGEEVFSAKMERDTALFEMLNSLRREAGLPTLKRMRKLDIAARQHSAAMARAGRIAHDIGSGTPDYRVERSGVVARATGENVAKADSVLALHRVLYASPSHRENMLLRRWNHVGIAIIEGEDGKLYATEIFVDD